MGNGILQANQTAALAAIIAATVATLCGKAGNMRASSGGGVHVEAK